MSIITLPSELQIGHEYLIYKEGPFEYLGYNNRLYSFKKQNITKTFDSNGIEKLIDIQGLENYTNRNITVPEYPSLDELTFNTFQQPTKQLWASPNNITSHFSYTDLLALNELCHDYKVSEIPTPGTPKYMQLLGHPEWETLKKYLTRISPTIDLPENFG